MKIKDLLKKLGNDINIEIDGKEITEADLKLEVKKIEIHTKTKEKDDLESLGYSYEIGV